jgi:hypothetical protein
LSEAPAIDSQWKLISALLIVKALQKGNTMAGAPKLRASAHGEIPLAADKVYGVICDFANVRRWPLAILAEHIERWKT